MRTDASRRLTHGSSVRLIVDTNQIAEMARINGLSASRKKQTTIVLPPLVWEEYVLRARPQFGLHKLVAFNVRFGIGVWDVFEAVRPLTDAQIRGFEPFVSRKSRQHTKLLADLVRCDQGMIDLARVNAGQRRLDFREIELDVRANAKKEQDARSRGEKVSMIEEMKDINECLRVSKGALVGPPDTIPVVESTHRQSPAAIESFQPLPEAVLDNPFIARFLRIFSAQISAFQGMWENKDLNITASENRNDFTDMSLALYANDGDIILSNDRKFRRLFEHCEQESRVRVMTWQQYLDSID